MEDVFELVFSKQADTVRPTKVTYVSPIHKPTHKLTHKPNISKSLNAEQIKRQYYIKPYFTQKSPNLTKFKINNSNNNKIKINNCNNNKNKINKVSLIPKYKIKKPFDKKWVTKNNHNENKIKNKATFDKKNYDNFEHKNKPTFDKKNYGSICCRCLKRGHGSKNCKAEYFRCNGCGEKGHHKYQCPRQKCYACDKLGHMKKNCPHLFVD